LQVEALRSVGGTRPEPAIGPIPWRLKIGKKMRRRTRDPPQMQRRGSWAPSNASEGRGAAVELPGGGRPSQAACVAADPLMGQSPHCQSAVQEEGPRVFEETRGFEKGRHRANSSERGVARRGLFSGSGARACRRAIFEIENTCAANRRQGSKAVRFAEAERSPVMGTEHNFRFLEGRSQVDRKWVAVSGVIS